MNLQYFCLKVWLVFAWNLTYFAWNLTHFAWNVTNFLETSQILLGILLILLGICLNFEILKCTLWSTKRLVCNERHLMWYCCLPCGFIKLELVRQSINLLNPRIFPKLGYWKTQWHGQCVLYCVSYVKGFIFDRVNWLANLLPHQNLVELPAPLVVFHESSEFFQILKK